MRVYGKNWGDKWVIFFLITSSLYLPSTRYNGIFSSRAARFYSPAPAGVAAFQLQKGRKNKGCFILFNY
ncbi:MAG: hypothetical protein D6730_17765 [Bacteroidetes bacterium]|nr:MAG: hypothetical protein D6730_17765 [Bacteroidota bacterium]